MSFIKGQIVQTPSGKGRIARKQGRTGFMVTVAVSRTRQDFSTGQVTTHHFNADRFFKTEDIQLPNPEPAAP